MVNSSLVSCVYGYEHTSFSSNSVFSSNFAIGLILSQIFMLSRLLHTTLEIYCHCSLYYLSFSFHFAKQLPQRSMASSLTRFLDHIQRRTIVGRTPLGEWSARRRRIYITTHNIHNRQTSMPPAGFEPAVSAGEGPQTYVLDRAATETYNITEPRALFYNSAVYSNLNYTMLCVSLVWLSPIQNLFFILADGYVSNFTVKVVSWHQRERRSIIT